MADEGCGCGCRAPARQDLLSIGDRSPAASSVSTSGFHGIQQVTVPAGSFLMGDSSGDRNPGDGELPLHEVSLGSFSIDATTVTNDAFAAFIDAAGYLT